MSEHVARETTAPAMAHHVPALDGVRGLAIFIVVLYHANAGAQAGNAPVRFLSKLLQIGWGGVTLFFVLSGFLITGNLCAMQGKPRWWRSFYIRRALRIFPLYYGALLIILLAAIALHTFKAALEPLLVYALYLQNLPVPNALPAAIPLELGHFWSLAVEEQFYLVWPLLLATLPNWRRARQVCLVLFVISIALRAFFFHLSTPNFGDSMPAHMGELLAGAWLALALRDNPGWWPHLRRLAPPILLFSLLAVASIGWASRSMRPYSFAMYVFGTAGLSLAGLALVIMALGRGRTARMLSFGPLRRLGVISYGLYVFHFFLYPIFARVGEHLFAGSSPNTVQLGIRLVMVVTSYCLAELSFRYFEKPILQLKQRWAPANEASSPRSSPAGQLRPNQR